MPKNGAERTSLALRRFFEVASDPTLAPTAWGAFERALNEEGRRDSAERRQMRLFGPVPEQPSSQGEPQLELFEDEG